jgi:hypothetical protein
MVFPCTGRYHQKANDEKMSSHKDLKKMPVESKEIGQSVIWGENSVNP